MWICFECEICLCHFQKQHGLYKRVLPSTSHILIAVRGFIVWGKTGVLFVHLYVTIWALVVLFTWHVLVFSEAQTKLCACWAVCFVYSRAENITMVLSAPWPLLCWSMLSLTGCTLTSSHLIKSEVSRAEWRRGQQSHPGVCCVFKFAVLRLDVLLDQQLFTTLFLEMETRWRFYFSAVISAPCSVTPLFPHCA